MTRYPSFFIGHGAPTSFFPQSPYKKDLERFARNLHGVKTIIAFSAHWQKHLPIEITSSPKPSILYDFYGFPEELYKETFKVPGNPELAKKIQVLLESQGYEAQLNNERGLDHGVWIPLKLMFPKEDVSVIQISIPFRFQPQELYRIGEVLRPLRNEQNAFFGSGNIVHNLNHVYSRIADKKIIVNDYDPWDSGDTEEWAETFDNWVKAKLVEKDVQSILLAEKIAPNYSMAVPTPEHFEPVYLILGTMLPNETIEFIHESFQLGTISMTSFKTVL